MSIDQCLWCRYSCGGELKGVIGIHVDDFLIGLADGEIGEKRMSEIRSLYRWGSRKTSESDLLESECDNSVILQKQLISKTTPTDSSLKLPSHVNDGDSGKNL